jgi:hypothetical protein
MSANALATRQDLLPDPNAWKTMLAMAEEFVKSGLLPNAIKSPAAALAIIQTGQELGIPPMYALRNIGIIGGKPVVGAEVMLAMIYRDHGGDAVQFEETGEKRCTVLYKRRGWPEYRTFSWTIEEAVKAGLANKDVWKGYAPAMLRARCISAVARLAFPDTIGGMYLPEELGADVDVVDGEVVVVDAPAPVVSIKTGEVIQPTTTEEERARAMVDGPDAGAVPTLREHAITRCHQLAAHAESIGHEKAAEIARVKPEKLSDQKLRQWVEKLEAMFPNVEEHDVAAAVDDEPF